MNVQQAIIWIEQNKEAVGVAAAAIYDVIVRIIPTAKSWSIVGLISRLWSLIPDNKAGGGTH